MIIVADTTPISELAKVNYVNLLPELFGRVVIPQGVYDELTTGQHPAALIVGGIILAGRSSGQKQVGSRRATIVW